MAVRHTHDNCRLTLAPTARLFCTSEVAWSFATHRQLQAHSCSHSQAFVSNLGTMLKTNFDTLTPPIDDSESGVAVS